MAVSSSSRVSFIEIKTVIDPQNLLLSPYGKDGIQGKRGEWLVN